MELQGPHQPVPVDNAIWRSTRYAFLAGNLEIEIAESLPRLSGEFGGAPLPDSADRIFAIPGRSDYVIAQRNDGDPRFCFLVHVDTAGVIGGVDGWSLYVDEAHRGSGLGSELAYAAMALSGDDATEYGLYSVAGYEAFRKAQLIAVERALEAGLPVPDWVLEDYPELSAPRPG